MADRGKALITVLRLLPKNLLSRAVGALVALPLPGRWLRRAVIGRFAAHFGADVSEAALPIEEYGSIAEFFTRRLVAGARPVATGPPPGRGGDPGGGRADAVLVSPADGRVLLAGPVERGDALQIKGKAYRVADLLPGEDAAVERLSAGAFATVYLSPRDYHRVHCPVSGRIVGWLLVPGALWPVNAAGVAHVDRLFCRNERLATFIESDAHGLVAVVMVGATNVGCMTVAYDASLRTNTSDRAVRRGRLSAPVPVAAGDELGVFHMGSTVVVLTERSGLACPIGAGEPVRMGAALLAPGP